MRGGTHGGPHRPVGLVLILLLVLAMCLFPTTSDAGAPSHARPPVSWTAEEQAFLDAHPVLRYGADPDYLPMDGVDENGRHTGMSDDYLRVLESILGVKLEMIPGLTWPDIIRGARENTLDLIACIGKTDDRLSYLAYTEPYVEFPAVIITQKDNQDLGGMETLRGKRVAVVDGFWTIDIMKVQYPDLVQIVYPNGRRCMEAVSIGEVDAFATDLSAASYLMQELGLSNLRISEEFPYVLALHMAVPKDKAILAGMIDKALAAMSDQEKEDIYLKWIHITTPEPFDVRIIWGPLLGVLGVSGAVAAFVLSWNRALKRQVVAKTRELEKELGERRIAEEKYAQVFQQAADVIGIVRLSDSRIAEVNKAFFVTFRYAPDEVMGRTTLDIGLWADPEHRNTFYRQMTLSDGHVSMEANWLTRDREIRYGILSAERLIINGEACAAVVWHDDTERRKNLEALRQVNESLEQKVQDRTRELEVQKEKAEAASRSKSIFLANISHEFRTPLNAILGYSRLLLRSRSLLPQQEADVEIISRSGEHLLGLINEVLELSRIEAGHAMLAYSTFPLRALLADIETMFRIRAQEKKLGLVFHVATDVPDHVAADEGKLRQILINLIGNAVKFTQHGGIDVRVRAGEPVAAAAHVTGDPENGAGAANQSQGIRLVIEVEDTGPGIDEQDIRHLFQPFRQLEAGVVVGGTGLGLSISQEFARLMGGDVTVRSDPGRGSCFTAEVLLQESLTGEGIRPASRIVRGLAPGQPRYRALVADDMEENRQLLVRMLQRLDFEVREAADGQAALAIWRLWKPELVLMDLRMPVMDGFDAMQAIRAEDPDAKTRMVVVTASVFEEERERVLHHTMASEFVRKPVEEEALFDALQRALDLAYLYEDAVGATGPESGAASADNGHAGAPASRFLPEEARTAFLDAVDAADVDVVLMLCDTWEAVAPEAVREIRSLSGQYRYDAITAFVKQGG